MMDTKKRVIEIMKENNMDVNNKILVIDFSILYITAQRDLLAQQLEEMKNGNRV